MLPPFWASSATPPPRSALDFDGKQGEDSGPWVGPLVFVLGAIPGEGRNAYGGYPDIDALYKEQALVIDRRKREALLYQIQQLIHERVRFGPIWEYIWPSGMGPRVEEPALMLINPYPWAAPLEEVRLKKK